MPKSRSVAVAKSYVDKAFRAELAKIRSGAQDRLEGVYPDSARTRLIELTALVDSLAENLAQTNINFRKFAERTDLELSALRK